MSSKNIKLSICCITYNHSQFIRQALEGFVNQKTNFEFEVLIYDDASTDDNQEIIKEYAEKFPNIIKPILQTENQFSKGIYVDKKFNWPRITGEYVALCEGDDFWTDENKLQKQVDFLDSHKDYTVCFHTVKMIWENDSHNESYFPTPEYRFNKTTLSITDLLKQNFIQTNSVVYRWQLKDQEALFPEGILPCDYFLHLLHASKGKIGFLPEVMSVYRKHDGGLWAGCGQTDDWFMRAGIPHIAFYSEVEKKFYVDKSDERVFLAKRCIEVFLKHAAFEKLKYLNETFPNEYFSAIGVAPKSSFECKISPDEKENCLSVELNGTENFTEFQIAVWHDEKQQDLKWFHFDNEQFSDCVKYEIPLSEYHINGIYQVHIYSAKNGVKRDCIFVTSIDINFLDGQILNDEKVHDQPILQPNSPEKKPFFLPMIRKHFNFKKTIYLAFVIFLIILIWIRPSDVFSFLGGK